MKHCRPLGLLALWATLSAGGAPAATLAVGPGKEFARPEEANAKAQAGDIIEIHPRKDGAPYEKVALFVRQKGLTFRARPAKGETCVRLSGKGFDYSGVGSTPRAIVQFNPGTDGCVLEGFELFGAHNESHNGAGVRINQANRVTVRRCHIHHNDMGIMSNGDGSSRAALDQLVESCEVDHNGDPTHPGYNHNFYLGGASVTLRFCDVHHALTGHNVKSRAHHTRVEYCYVHDSANREFDLVDAAETILPESHAVLTGNLIVKDPQCKGNKAVIHFGQDGGREHDGTVYLVHNTVVTPFLSPVVDLSASKAGAEFTGNLLTDGGHPQQGQVVAQTRNGAGLGRVTGTHNWFASGFQKIPATGIDWASCTFGDPGAAIFRDPGARDFHLAGKTRGIVDAGEMPATIRVPPLPGAPQGDRSSGLLAWQYRHPCAGEPREDKGKPDLGAYAFRGPR